jgi:hypothetical protein
MQHIRKVSINVIQLSQTTKQSDGESSTHFARKYHLQFSRKLFQVKVQALQMKNGKFEQIMSSKYLDMCAILAGRSKGPFFLQMLVEVMKKDYPGFIHKCPYIGLTEANNVTFSRQMIVLYPTGEFKVIVVIADGRREIIQIEEVFIMS